MRGNIFEIHNTFEFFAILRVAYTEHSLEQNIFLVLAAYCLKSKHLYNSRHRRDTRLSVMQVYETLRLKLY